MRILVFSDSHGHLREMNWVIKREAKFDMLMHAGDYGEDLDRVCEQRGLDVPIYRVRGNCDYNSMAFREQVVDVLGVKILIVHGNRHGVKTSVNRLNYYALEKGADIVVFGHTHHPLVQNTGEIYMLNPGSIAVPHGRGKSYGIIEIDENSERKIDIKTVRFGR